MSQINKYLQLTHSLLPTMATWQYPFAVNSIGNINPALPNYLDRFAESKLEIYLTQTLLCKLRQLPEPSMILVVHLLLMCPCGVVPVVLLTISDQDLNTTQQN
jgi:hypothetical protein